MCACGQPLIGTKFVHLPGCPSASEREITYRCEHCGAASPDEFDLVHGICVGCLESAFDVPLGLLYIQRDLTRFFTWDQGICYDQTVDPTPLNVRMYGELIQALCSPIDCERNQAEQSLMEYCLEDLEEWTQFLKQEGVF